MKLNKQDRNVRFLPMLAVLLACIIQGMAHDTSEANAGQEHAHYDWSVKPPERVDMRWLMAKAEGLPRQAGLGTTDQRSANEKPLQAAPFELFAPRLKVRWDESFLYVEGNGLPGHNMMVGITAWQQQVPLPQAYTGNNAWRIPLKPKPSLTPTSIKDRFLRGAIAFAVNGIPIFNPQNNRGEISAEIGELDQWGGHCGRADDYHYHAAPLHLEKAVGKSLPIAFALDGYAIFGLSEPDGGVPEGLDSFHGHTTAGLGYHYHASTKYPYVNGGFHGMVSEAGGQVDPQPQARPIRGDQPPLRGAKITEFSVSSDEKKFEVKYAVNGKPGEIHYQMVGEGTWKFNFTHPDGSTQQETYSGDGSGRSRRGGDRPPGGRSRNRGELK